MAVTMAAATPQSVDSPRMFAPPPWSPRPLPREEPELDELPTPASFRSAASAASPEEGLIASLEKGRIESPSSPSQQLTGTQQNVPGYPRNDTPHRSLFTEGATGSAPSFLRNPAVAEGAIVTSPDPKNTHAKSPQIQKPQISSSRPSSISDSLRRPPMTNTDASTSLGVASTPIGLGVSTLRVNNSERESVLLPDSPQSFPAPIDALHPKNDSIMMTRVLDEAPKLSPTIESASAQSTQALAVVSGVHGTGAPQSVESASSGSSSHAHSTSSIPPQQQKLESPTANYDGVVVHDIPKETKILSELIKRVDPNVCRLVVRENWKKCIYGNEDFAMSMVSCLISIFCCLVLRKWKSDHRMEE